MNIVAVRILREFWGRHPDSEQPLKAWVARARRAAWTQPSEVKADFGSASILQNCRVVFNVKGNDYRLIVSVNYEYKAAYVKFIGTHRQYDAIDANTIELEN